MPLVAHNNNPMPKDAYPAPMNAILSNTLKLLNLPEELKNLLVERLQMKNPKYEENQRMGRWNKGTPKILRFYQRAGANGLIVPRGFIR